MADFVTLAALKLALDVTDTSSDALLALANATATDMLIDYMQRDPRADDFSERARGLGSDKILVREYPINSVASITIPSRDPLQPGQLLSPDLYDFDNYVISRIDGGIFARGSRIPIAYNAGLDPAPRQLALAAVYTVRAQLSARKIDLNSTGESWQGVSSQTWNGGLAGVVPLAAQVLLKTLIRTMSP